MLLALGDEGDAFRVKRRKKLFKNLIQNSTKKMMKCFYETLGRQDDWDEEQVLQSQPYCQPCIAKTCNVHHFPEKFWVKFVKFPAVGW